MTDPPAPSLAATVVPVDPGVGELLEATAAAFVESLVALDARGAAFAGKVGSIARMGDRELREAAAATSRALDRLAGRDHEEPRGDDDAWRQEQAALWATCGRLRQYALLAACLDRALEERIVGLEAGDPARAGALRHDVRLHVRRRHQDLLAGLAVAVQGYLALDLGHRPAAVGARGVDDGAPVGAGELALPASLPPAGVLPASVSGGD